MGELEPCCSVFKLFARFEHESSFRETFSAPYTDGKEMGVTQYSLGGDFIKDHHSAASAGRELGVGRTSIRQSIRPGGTCEGFQFRDTKNNTIPVGVVEDRRYIDCVSQYELSGEFVKEFKNAVLAGKSLNTSRTGGALSVGIIRACARDGGVYLKYKWEKTDGDSFSQNGGIKRKREK